MPSKPNERQYRTLTATLAPLKRADEGGEEPKKRFDSDYYVEGYASTFNDPYPIYCDFAGNEYLEIISHICRIHFMKNYLEKIRCSLAGRIV